MKPAPTHTNPDERRRVLDDIHYNLLMELIVGATGRRKLQEAKALGQNPGAHHLPTAIRRAKTFLRTKGTEMIAFTTAHPEYFEQTAGAMERASALEPLLCRVAKQLRR